MLSKYIKLRPNYISSIRKFNNLNDNKSNLPSSTITNSNTPKLPLSLLQKSFLTIGSSVIAILNPWRGDMIAVLSEATGESVLPSLVRQLKSSEEGLDLLSRKFRVTSDTIDLEKLSKLSHNTFGYQYYIFMKKQQFQPEDRLTVKFITNPEEAYALQRYRESHDYWHVLCGLPTTVVGELAQKYLEFFQTNLPSSFLASAVGPIRLNFSDKIKLFQTYVPWAIICNQSIKKPLLSIHYEKYFESDVDELRSKWGITKAPIFQDLQ